VGNKQKELEGGNYERFALSLQLRDLKIKDCSVDTYDLRTPKGDFSLLSYPSPSLRPNLNSETQLVAVLENSSEELQEWGGGGVSKT